MHFNICKQLIKYYKVLIISFLALFALRDGYSQNFIRNSSFELYYKCPENYTAWTHKYQLIPHWTFPTKGTSDHFHRCSAGIVGVPVNYVGKSEARSGDGYCGIITKGSQPNYREYLQTKLLLTLKSNTKYCVRFYYRLATLSKYAMNRLGVYFHHSEIVEDIESTLFFKPQLELTKEKFLANKTEWKEFCGVYKGTGIEKFMIIGNFYPDEYTDLKLAETGELDTTYLIDYPYYYIDDVSVHAIENCYKCSCDPDSYIQYDIKVEKVTIKGGNDGKVFITNVKGGAPPYKYYWSNGVKNKHLTNAKAGEYVFKITDSEGCSDSTRIHVAGPSGIDQVFHKVKVGIPVILEYIYFDFDEAILLPESFDELNLLVKLLKESPETRIEIRGHTDSKGTNEYNIALSNARANAVVNYLAESGISAERLIYKGYGETLPIASNNTDEGRAKNRRVEFVIIKR